MAPAWGPKLERPGQFLGPDGDRNGRDLPQHELQQFQNLRKLAKDIEKLLSALPDTPYRQEVKANSLGLSIVWLYPEKILGR